MPRPKISALRSPYKAALVGGATITVGAEGSNAINVAIQLLDQNLRDLAQRGTVGFYLSDDANGDSITATAPSSGIAIGTDGLMREYITDKAGRLTSESDGDIDITLTEASTGTWYLVLEMPDGSLKVSGAITFV